MNLNFLTNPTQRAATGKRIPTAELETLLLYGGADVRLKVLAKASPNGHVLAANPNTHHLMEALVRVSDPSGLAELIFAIRRQVAALAQSRYGNVVIQEILKKVPSVVKNDLVVSLVEQAYQIACGEFGNRVIQVLLHDAASAEKLYDALLPNFTGLATNEFGQIVVGHGLSMSDDCPFWEPISASSRQLMTSLWNDNRHHVILPVITRAATRCTPADRLFRLITKVLVEELVVDTLKGYEEENEMSDDDEDEDAKKHGDLPEGMTKEERDEMIAERKDIYCALLSSGVEKWRDSITSAMIEIHNTQEQKMNKKKKKNSKKNSEDAAVEEQEEESSSPLFYDWSKKQHLTAIVECTLRENASSPANSKKLCTIFQNNEQTLVEMIGDRYAAIVARELVKHGDTYGDVVFSSTNNKKNSKNNNNNTTVASLVSQAATLCKQSSYSSFFQALAQSSKKYADELADILLKNKGGCLKKDEKENNDNNNNEDDADASDKKKNKKKKNKNNNTIKKSEEEEKKKSENENEEEQEEEKEQDAEDVEAQAVIAEDEKNIANKTLAEASIEHPSASHLLQCLLGLNDASKLNPAKLSAILDVVFNRVVCHPAILSRSVTSPHGTHVVQALLKVVNNDQIKQFAALCLKARVQGKFFGTSALARNKYGCHTMVVLLKELKRRKDELENVKNDKDAAEDMMENGIRLIMNSLKPHVHFLALAASTGRHVFDTMCQVGSATLKKMMYDLVAMKCETYLKGDPYLEGNEKAGTSAVKNKLKAQSGSKHPFKAKHDAKRRTRSS